MTSAEATWDAARGTAGGATFGEALRAYATQREVGLEKLADACGLTAPEFEHVLSGAQRLTIAELARLVQALRARPIEFLQRTSILSLEVYAFGLDPLYFLPEGQVRYEARIYMREINPRHQVPEGDMTRRNAAIKAIIEDELLDPVGKIELELGYLLRTASQQTGGTL
ncbi:MAG: helix-turn-helix domain-containing protein [Candidatus Eremiobacteraeota bacterium]|nr:helix-turn-helix domain-containing protein [Candidatus Eremiobacteraeota bacterium]